MRSIKLAIRHIPTIPYRVVHYFLTGYSHKTLIYDLFMNMIVVAL